LKRVLASFSFRKHVAMVGGCWNDTFKLFTADMKAILGVEA